MKAIIQDIVIPLTRDLVVTLELDSPNETLPPVTITVTGGTLNINRSNIKTIGSVSFHPFRSTAMDSHKQKLMAHGLTEGQVHAVEAAGFNLAALLQLITQYGPQALQILLAILATLKPAPTPPAV